jgi:hypothetical protein
MLEVLLEPNCGTLFGVFEVGEYAIIVKIVR